ncbi:dipeptide epimerase [Parvularcula flava]|nr:dipeptide epimerase [Aquisalinus luteolus]
MTVEREKWPLREPFAITGHTFVDIDIVVVRLSDGTHTGSGEGVGVYYFKDTSAGMEKTLNAIRDAVEADPGREEIQSILPPGGARNALDSAYWDLDAQRLGKSAWQLAGLDEPKPLVTTFTIGAGDPETVGRTALSFKGAQAIKIKLTGEPVDVDRVNAVRQACPDVWIGVDANQGYTRASLEKALPHFAEAGVALVEQPLPMGQDQDLEGLECPIPLAADESVQSLPDIAAVAPYYHYINIKLDKCGGLTEGLKMAGAARERGMKVMVGNMVGTALSVGPAYLLGQLCDVVDLDSPFMLGSDRKPPVLYKDGYVICPPEIWGSRRSTNQPAPATLTAT